MSLIQNYEYIRDWANNRFLKKGDQADVDLSNYPTKSEVQQALSEIDLSEYATKDEIIWKRGSKTGSAVLNNIGTADGNYSVVEGYSCITGGNKTSNDLDNQESSDGTSGACAHAEGNATIAKGYNSHAEGCRTFAPGDTSHVEGYFCISEGSNSHAEGENAHSIGTAAHAENEGRAYGNYSHAEGTSSSVLSTLSLTGNANATSYTYSSLNQHPKVGMLVRGLDKKFSKITTVNTSTRTITLDRPFSNFSLSNSNVNLYSGATGEYSHAEGQNTTAIGQGSHTEGVYTIAGNQGEHASGKYNVSSDETSFSHGIGEDVNHRKNALEISNNGDVFIYGVGDYDGTNPDVATTAQDIINGYVEDEEVIAASLNDLNTRLNTVSGTVTNLGNGIKVLSTGEVFIKGVGTYDGTNAQAGTNDVATIIADLLSRL